MTERIKLLADESWNTFEIHGVEIGTPYAFAERFAKLILANADKLRREANTDPINKPFELDPKFIAKCDQLGRSRRQFQ